MERVVVYPGKLPIVYDRNSVWEGEPPEQGSEDAEKHWWDLCASTGNWCWDVRWSLSGGGGQRETLEGHERESSKLQVRRTLKVA